MSKILGPNVNECDLVARVVVSGVAQTYRLQPNLTFTVPGGASLTDAALLGFFLRMPLLGLKVLAGIHWEALLIWRKGFKFRPLPPAPINPVTIVG